MFLTIFMLFCMVSCNVFVEMSTGMLQRQHAVESGKASFYMKKPSVNVVFYVVFK